MTEPITDALKEWAVVCEALGRGHQAFVARAGGIADDGFEAEARRFALLPSRFHDDDSRLRPDAAAELRGLRPPADGRFTARYAAELTHIWDVTDAGAVERLVPLQALAAGELRGRFEMRGGLLRVAALRVRRLDEPVVLEPGEWSGGCRSWVEMPRPLAGFAAAVPVLTDSEYADAIGRIERVLSRRCDARG